MIMSFGSIAKISQMDDRMRNIFFEIFRSFPRINFIVKYETIDEPVKKIEDNIFLAKWIPQIELMSKSLII